MQTVYIYNIYNKLYCKYFAIETSCLLITSIDNFEHEKKDSGALYGRWGVNKDLTPLPFPPPLA